MDQSVGIGKVEEAKQVWGQLDLLSNTLAMLESKIIALEERLGHVTRPIAVKEEKDMAQPRQLVPLAEDIRDARQAVECMRENVESILNRLEL